MKQLTHIGTAGFMLKPDAPEIKPIYEKIREQFGSKGIKVLLSKKSAAMIGTDGIPFENKMKELTSELAKQMEEGKKLDEEIKKNLEGIGYGL